LKGEKNRILIDHTFTIKTIQKGKTMIYARVGKKKN